MNDLFLEISRFSDVHFTGKDVAYIISLLVTLLTAWYKLKHDNERQNEKIGTLDRRINYIQKEVKENRESFANEIKDMNLAINEVKTDTSEIKGMLNILINKNK
jgi:hypothetical protein